MIKDLGCNILPSRFSLQTLFLPGFGVQCDQRLTASKVKSRRGLCCLYSIASGKKMQAPPQKTSSTPKIENKTRKIDRFKNAETLYW